MIFPKISIVVLNWNGKQDTLDCMASLKEIDYSNYEVLIADNASTDGSENAIREAYPAHPFIQNGANVGFAGGNNPAIKLSLERGAELVLLLNNDTTVDPGVLKAMVRAAEKYPGTGIFGAKILYHSRPDTIWFAGGFWDAQKHMFVHRGMGQLDQSAFSADIEVDYACGCALMIRKEAIESIGFMDEAYFFTYEETDWCYRARAAGYEIRLISDAKVFHKVSASSGGDGSPMQTYFLTRNLLRWAKRNLQPDEFASVRRQVVYDIASVFGRTKWAYVRLLGAMLMPRFSREMRDNIFRAKVLGLRDAFVRRWGMGSQHARRNLSVGNGR